MGGASVVLAMVMASWPGDGLVGTHRTRVDVIEGNQIVSLASVEMPNGQIGRQWQYGPMYVNFRRWQADHRWYRVMDWVSADDVLLDWNRGRPVAYVWTSHGLTVVRAWRYEETWGGDTEVAERPRYEARRMPPHPPGLKGLKR